MSREVMGSALEDVSTPEPAAPRADRAVRIDDRATAATSAPAHPDTPTPTSTPTSTPGSAPGSPPAPARPLAGRSHELLLRAQEQVDRVRSSRLRTAAAVGVAALVAGLVGAGVTAQLQQAGRDRASGVIAWLEYGTGPDLSGNDRVSTRLNVVNTGDQEVTIDEVDFGGGLEEGRTSGVSGTLSSTLTVAPGAYASTNVLAQVEDCSQGLMSRGGSRDGTLRVSVSGADLRSTWVDGARVGAFPFSASSVVEMACMRGEELPVLVENTIVRADGDLYLTLRTNSPDDVLLDLRGPDGITLVTDPPLPLLLPAGQASTVTLGVELRVDTCTVSAQQLDAGNQVRFVVGEEEYYALDSFVVNPWVVREVTRAC